MKAIIVSDLHLRVDTPRCRKDEDFVETQKQQLQFIFKQCRKHKAPLIVVGDIFHTATVSDTLKTMFITAAKGTEVFAIAGQHDEPFHSWDNIHKSSFGVLWEAGILKPLKSVAYAHFGGTPDAKGHRILFLHQLVFRSTKDMPPNVDAITAPDLLKQYPDVKWIFCGDNHHGFHYEKNGRHVIMCGAFNRQAADMIDYQPVVYLVDLEKDFIEAINIPDDTTLVTDTYLRTEEEREERIEAFVEKIRDSKEITLDFAHNVHEAIKMNKKLSYLTKQTILEFIEE
jgi:DNA repair exonuclease SbcCD nuclease subunit